MPFYHDITTEISTAFGSPVLENAPSRHQSVKILTVQNLSRKDCALREKARQHSQFYAVGRLMIILSEQLVAILLVETEVEHAQSKAGH